MTVYQPITPRSGVGEFKTIKCAGFTQFNLHPRCGNAVTVNVVATIFSRLTDDLRPLQNKQTQETAVGFLRLKSIKYNQAPKPVNNTSFSASQISP